MELAGYFLMSNSSVNDGYHEGFSANLNTFINPMGWSRFIPSLPLAISNQYEGFCYLGMGGILFVTYALMLAIKNYKLVFDKLIILWPLLLVVTFFSLLAVSNYFTFSKYIIASFYLPSWVTKICGIFRSSGRFIWVLYYALLIFSFWVVLKWKSVKFSKNVILWVCIIQLLDLSAKFKEIRHGFLYDTPTVPVLQSISRSASQFKHIVVVPKSRNWPWESIGYFAVVHGLTLSDGYFSRPNKDLFNEYAKMQMHRLGNGLLDDKTLYVVTDEAFLKKLDKKFYTKSCIRRIDGILLVYSNKYSCVGSA
jgi:hypothetical protein